MLQSEFITAIIRLKLGELSKSEAVVAEWILANEERVASMSMGQVARECGLSDTSVLRLCRRVGLQGFTELKFRIVADRAREAVDENDASTEPLPAGARSASALFDECSRGLKSTLENLGDSLDRAIDIIEAAAEVLVIGVGTSTPTVIAAQEQLFLCGLKCRAQTDTYLQRMEVALLAAPSAVLAISHSGASVDSVEVLQAAKERGLSTICLTGMPGAPLTKYADVTLAALTTEIRNEPVAGRIVQLALVSALARAYATRHSESSGKAERAAFRSVIEKTL